jgi:hypothetical protein
MSDPGPGAATRAGDDERNGNPAQLKRYPTAATAKAAVAVAAAARILSLRVAAIDLAS